MCSIDPIAKVRVSAVGAVDESILEVGGVVEVDVYLAGFALVCD